MSNFTGKTQFDFIFDALAYQFPGLVRSGDNSMFQFASAPTAARWYDSKESLAAAYNLANAGSLNLDGFYVQGGSIAISYRDLINSLKTRGCDKDPRYNELVKLIGDAANQQAELSTAADGAYAVWAKKNLDPATGNPTEDKNAWLNDPFGGKSFKTKMEEYQKQIDEWGKEQEDLLTEIDKPIRDAKEALADPDNKMEISYASGNTDTVYKTYIAAGLTDDKARWDRAPEGDYEFDVVINKDRVIKYPWKTVVETKVEKTCFKTKVDISVNMERIIVDEHYELRVAAVGMQSYAITRGNWYSPAFVNPNMELVDSSQLKIDYFFGKAGKLHLIPQNVVVMYKPEITLTISTQCYKEQFSPYANTDLGWIEVFGSRLTIGDGGKLQPVDNGNGTISIKFKSPANAEPQVLGLQSEVVYTGR